MAETLCGSPLYMAPEILRYERYDAKADLWSVGAVLYEMCVGKPPFRAQNHMELLRRIEKGEDKIRFPDEKSPSSTKEQNSLNPNPPKPAVVAQDLKELIRGLLKRNPVERISFDDFFKKAEAAAVSGTAAAVYQQANPMSSLAAQRPGTPAEAVIGPKAPSPKPQLNTRRSSFAPKYVTGSPVVPHVSPTRPPADKSRSDPSTLPVDIPPPSAVKQPVLQSNETLKDDVRLGATPDLIAGSR